MFCIYLTTGNIIQTTDLKTTSFIVLYFWADEFIFIYLFPFRIFLGGGKKKQNKTTSLAGRFFVR